MGATTSLPASPSSTRTPSSYRELSPWHQPNGGKGGAAGLCPRVLLHTRHSSQAAPPGQGWDHQLCPSCLLHWATLATALISDVMNLP